MSERLRAPWERLWHYFSAAAGQGVNSVSNLIVVALLAAGTSRSEFGTCAMILAALPLGQAFMRGFLLEPFVLRSSNEAHRYVVKIAAMFGALMGAWGVLVGILSGLKPDIWIGLVAGMVFACLQEALRWLALADRRRAAAVASDASWLCTQALVAGSFGIGAASGAIGWGMGALVAVAVLAGRLSDVAPSVVPPRRLLNWRWGTEHVAAAGTLQLAVLLMPLTSTTEDAGTLRGVMTLLGPATVLVGASHQAVVTIMQREMSYGARRLLGQRTSLILILLLIVASAPTFLLSDNVGERLLGPTWSTARPLLLIAVLQKVGVALASGPLFVLRTSGLPAEVSLRLRLGITGMTLGGVVVGSQLDGARGSLIALAAGSICAGVAWQMLLIVTGRRQTEAGSP